MVTHMLVGVSCWSNIPEVEYWCTVDNNNNDNDDDDEGDDDDGRYFQNKLNCIFIYLECMCLLSFLHQIILGYIRPLSSVDAYITM